MAPEVLDTEKEEFTVKMDVYSYAICMWEMYSGGKLPFDEFEEFIKVRTDVDGKTYADDVDVQGVKRAIIYKHIRPTIPHNCPPLLGTLIERCWAGDAVARPSFTSIVESLQQIKREMGITFPKWTSSSLDNFCKEHVVPDDNEAAAAVEEDESAQRLDMDGEVVVKHNVKEESVLALRNGKQNHPTCIAVVDEHVWVGRKDGSISILNYSGEWCELAHCKPHSERVYSMVFVRQSYGGMVWSCSDDGSICVSATGERPTVIKRIDRAHDATSNQSMFIEKANDADARKSKSKVECFSAGAISPPVRTLYYVVRQEKEMHGIKVRNMTMWSGSSGDCSVCIWNTQSFSLVDMFYVEEHVQTIRQVCLTTEEGAGNVWICGVERLFIVNPDDLGSMRIVQAHQGRIVGIACSAFQEVWTCSSDKTVKVWSALDFTHKHTIKMMKEKILNVVAVDKYIWCTDFNGRIVIFNSKVKLKCGYC
tara:strand:- start:1345 stop:2781 length:1437 start_codon:yes stop_codon:yes gene_type:complete